MKTLPNMLEPLGSRKPQNLAYRRSLEELFEENIHGLRDIQLL